jgi:transposase InsO family protein
MCKVLKISRSSYYYILNNESILKDESELIEVVKNIFYGSRQTYGTRRIKCELRKLNIIMSRRRIGRIMAEHGLVSKYTIASFKPQKSKVNEEYITNILNRNFDNKTNRQVVVSDLTYVRVGNRWHYICILLDLYNREIIGYSAGAYKTASLVKEAFQSIKGNLSAIELFHTDRGSEFKNKLIEELLEVFEIKRSLSRKGSPHDNAVAEAGFKTIKTEFVNGMIFASLDHLNLELFDYINWYNNHRLHSSLNYLSPVQFRQMNL